MSKLLLLPITLLFSPFLIAQNSLLSGAITGALPTGGRINDIELIDNGVDAVLIAVNEENKEIYAIDIDDNDWGEASDNLVTEIPDFSDLIDGATGSSISVIRAIEVNKISKAVYVLATTDASSISHLIKIEEDGAVVSVLDQSNLTYSLINWGTPGYGVQDMTWGDNTLFVTSGAWSLDGSIASISAPFVHDATMTKRNTSMFKTNWGGGYFTDAPLEKIEYAKIGDEHRLMGVTVCAPGFSIETSALDGSGTLEVEELFNVTNSPPKKVVHQNQAGDHYLFDLHSGGVLIRIGEEYIDGSKFTDGDYNASVQYLRTGGGAVTPGLTEDQVKIYPDTYTLISYWDDYNLLVLEDDVLKLLPTGTFTLGSSIKNDYAFSIGPNPATETLVFTTDYTPENGTLKIVSLDGKTMLEEKFTLGANTLNISELAQGAYIINVYDNNNFVYSEKLVVKKD